MSHSHTERGNAEHCPLPQAAFFRTRRFYFPQTSNFHPNILHAHITVPSLHN